MSHFSPPFLHNNQMWESRITLTNCFSLGQISVAIQSLIQSPWRPPAMVSSAAGQLRSAEWCPPASRRCCWWNSALSRKLWVLPVQRAEVLSGLPWSSRLIPTVPSSRGPPWPLCQKNLSTPQSPVPPPILFSSWVLKTCMPSFAPSCICMSSLSLPRS